MKGVAGNEFVNGWEKAGGGGERAGEDPVCRGGCNRSIAEAEVVAEEGNRRYGLRCPGLSTMESDAQVRRCANPPGPGRVTVKHRSHLGLTYTPCRPALEDDQTDRRTARANHDWHIAV